MLYCIVKFGYNENDALLNLLSMKTNCGACQPNVWRKCLYVSWESSVGDRKPRVRTQASQVMGPRFFNGSLGVIFSTGYFSDLGFLLSTPEHALMTNFSPPEGNHWGALNTKKKRGNGNDV